MSYRRKSQTLKTPQILEIYTLACYMLLKNIKCMLIVINFYTTYYTMKYINDSFTI